MLLVLLLVVEESACFAWAVESLILPLILSAGEALICFSCTELDAPDAAVAMAGSTPETDRWTTIPCYGLSGRKERRGNVSGGPCAG